MFLLRSDILGSSIFEKAGDAFLAPLRYSLGGKRSVCYPKYFLGYNFTQSVPIESECYSNWGTTAAKCAAFVPGIFFAIPGLFLKICGLANERTRAIYWCNDWVEAQTKLPCQALKSPFEVAKVCVSFFGLESLELFEKSLTQDQKFEIVKLGAHDWLYLESTIKRLGFSQEQKFEIAKLCTHIPGLIYALCGWGLTQLQRFEILKLCPPSCALFTSTAGPTPLHRMALTPQQNFEILKMHAAHFPDAVISHSTLLEEEDQKELFLWAVTHRVSPLKTIKKPEEGALSAYAWRREYKEDSIPFCFLENWLDESLYKEIQKVKNSKIRNAITDSIASALYVWKKRLSPEEFSWLNKENLLFLFTSLKTTSFIPCLIHSAAMIAKNREYRKKYEDLPLTLESKYPWVKLLKILLVRLEMSGVETEACQQLLTSLNSFKELSTPKLLNLFHTLKTLIEQPTLSNQEKTAIVRAMANGPLLQLMQEFLMIVELGQAKMLKDLSLGLSALAQAAFQKAFPTKLALPVDFAERFRAEIESYRNSLALKVYAGKMQRDHPEVYQALGDHVASILNGTYLQRRYDTTENPHLAIIPKKVLNEWQKNRQTPLEELLHGNEPAPKTETMLEWVRTKLLFDRHLDLQNFPYLKEYLESRGKTNIGTLIETLKKKSSLSKAEYEVLSLQRKLIDLARLEKKEDSLRLLNELQNFKTLRHTEFFNDIQSQIQKMSQEADTESSFTAHETDDHQDLLLCGTEIQGSCQRVDNDSFNEGLIGYLRHGQTRLLAIKRTDGSIVARSLLRLLWDGKKPALFLERIYSNYSDPRFLQAIHALAKETSQRLQCPLTQFIDSSEKAPRYGKSLTCLGGPAPYEYVDAANGNHANGKFTIAAQNLALVE